MCACVCVLEREREISTLPHILGLCIFKDVLIFTMLVIN